MDKWKKALELNGHEVFYIAGSSGRCKAEIIPALHYQHPINNKIVNNAYGILNDYTSDKDLEKQIMDLALTIEKDLVKIINPCLFEPEKVILVVIDELKGYLFDGYYGRSYLLVDNNLFFKSRLSDESMNLQGSVVANIVRLLFDKVGC